MVSLKCLLFGETVARVRRACKKDFLFYRCFFFCSKTFLCIFFSVIFKSIQSSKMKLSHLNSNFALTLLAWVILTQLWTTRPRYCYKSKQLTKFLFLGHSTCRPLLKFTIELNRYWQVVLTCDDIKDRPNATKLTAVTFPVIWSSA